MQENGLHDVFEKKLAYPCEYSSHSNFHEPKNLTKADFWSTLKQETPPHEEINRTQESIRKFSMNGQE